MRESCWPVFLMDTDVDILREDYQTKCTSTMSGHSLRAGSIHSRMEIDTCTTTQPQNKGEKTYHLQRYREGI